MRKVKEIKVKSVGYVHDPEATEKWIDIYIDLLMDSVKSEIKNEVGFIV